MMRSTSRYAAQRGDDARDQRDAADFDERFVGQIRCACRNRVGAAAGEHDCVHERHPRRQASGTTNVARRPAARSPPRARALALRRSHSAKRRAAGTREHRMGRAGVAQRAQRSRDRRDTLAAIDASKSLVVGRDGGRIIGALDRFERAQARRFGARARRRPRRHARALRPAAGRHRRCRRARRGRARRPTTAAARRARSRVRRCLRRARRCR